MRDSQNLTNMAAVNSNSSTCVVALSCHSLGSNSIGAYYDSSKGEMVATPEGPAALAQMLLVNKTLTSIKYVPSSLMKQLIKRQHPLTVLAFACSLACVCISLGSVSGNFLRAEGAAHLAEGIKSNTSLRELKCAPLITPSC